jgi:hypothetical protein
MMKMLVSPESEVSVSTAEERRSKTAILVLGMHRSGTSALAGALCVLGGGGPRTAMPPNSFNSRGYWESVPFVRANERLLSVIGSSWDEWQEVPLHLLGQNLLAYYRSSVRALIAREYAEKDLIVVKDPRVCRIAPLVLEALAGAGFWAIPYLVFRNPFDVASSLKRRDGLAIEQSLLLWLRHNLDAEFSTRGRARSVISFEELLTDWRKNLTPSLHLIPSYSEQLELSDERGKRVDAFLAEEMRHERRSAASLCGHPELRRWVEITYQALSVLARKDGDEQSLSELDNIRHRLNDVSSLFGPLVTSMRNELRNELREEQQKANELSIKLTKSSRDATSMREASVREVESVVLEFNKLADQLTKSSLDAERMREHFEFEASTLRSALDLSISQLKETKARDVVELARLNAHLSEEIAALHRSRSWKFTAPLRMVGRLVRMFG